MKNRIKIIAIVLALLAATPFIKAQTSGADYRNAVASLFPDLNLENKILFVSVWQSSNIDSRENNKEFSRVSNIYKEAKLKNGLKGVTFINLSVDKDTYMWMISVKKDGIISEYNLENSTGKYDSIAKLFGDYPGSIVVGSDSEIIAKNITKDNCFNTFRSLITR